MNYKWELQKFDTELFGFKTAKILQAQPQHVSELVNDFQKNTIKYAVFRFKASDYTLIHTLEKNGFLLVDGTIALEAKQYEQYAAQFQQIRIADKADIPALRLIAKSIFTYTRFYTDPVIPDHKAGEVYAQWIENSITGKAADKVLIWEEHKKILGFVTLQKTGHIVLIGVSESAQGKGIGRKLIQASFDVFYKWETEKIFLETQVINIPAIRSYQSCGFKITDSFVTFRWSTL